MADGESDQITQDIAENLRKFLDRPDESDEHSAYWEVRTSLPSPAPFGSWLSGPRQFQLGRNLLVFKDALVRLRRWGRRTIPAIYFENGSLPSSPENSTLLLSDDPISVALRDAWTAHRERRAETRRDRADEGAVIEMPLEESTRVFSNGLAIALVAVAGTAGNVHFTVNSRNAHYRVHVTEQYWYSPVVFGSNLSTPVDDVIYPANYRFGGDKSGGPIIWDSGIHTASASRTSTLVTKF